MATSKEPVEARSSDSGKKRRKKLSEIRIKRGAKGGHVITHHYDNGSGMVGGYHEPEEFPFGKGQGKEAMEHVKKHAGFKGGDDNDEDVEEAKEEPQGKEVASDEEEEA